LEKKGSDMRGGSRGERRGQGRGKRREEGRGREVLWLGFEMPNQKFIC
jgi:hypothetical protein